MKCLYIPKVINQEYALLWKRDEAVFLFLPWILLPVLGFFVGFIAATILTIILAQGIKQFSLDKPSGYMLHWLNYNFPKSFIARSIGGSKPEKTSLLFHGSVFPASHLRYIAG